VVDMAHPGTYSCRTAKNTLKYAHIVTSTTHNTLWGPRGGFIMIGKDLLIMGITTQKGEISMCHLF
jgi:glycine hydroxymethyltransferase